MIGILFALVIGVKSFDWSSNKISKGKRGEFKFVTPGEAIDRQQLWRQQLEEQSQKQQKQLEKLNKQIQEDHKTPNNNGRINSLEEQLEEIKQQLLQGKNPQTHTYPQTSQRKDSSSLIEPNTKFTSPENNTRIVSKLIIKNSIKPNSNSKNFLPAGSFARALLINSVDASCGVGGGSDPIPVMLRVMDNSILPGSLSSTTKRCHIIAAAHGDLASERVYMRLEKLSCSDAESGEIWERVVSGHIAGEDGKTGVRGIVAERTGPMLLRASIGGMISGISEILQQGVKTDKWRLSPKDEINKEKTLQDNLSQVGGASSAGTSRVLDKLADYYIKRAEQLQPIIQIDAGREINVVFTKGINMQKESGLSNNYNFTPTQGER